MTEPARGVVCVGFAEWNAELWTNQQHLMSRLAADRRVLFVESLGLRRPQVAGRDLRRIARRLVRGLAGVREYDGVAVLSPLVLPLHRVAAVRGFNAWMLRRQVRRAARQVGLRRPVLWAYVPQAEALIGTLEPERIVYHCVDDIAAQPGVDPVSFREAEDRYVAVADLVLTSAPSLADRLRPRAARLVEAPNVADTAAFATALDPGPVDEAMAALPAPRIVFTGAVVATKIDLELIASVARARPDWAVALVGPIGPGDPSTDVSELESIPNVHLLGGRRHTELPSVLRGADVGIIPYALNDLTRSVFPMKVYEYLAAGLPVVATRLPAVEGLPDVAVADDPPAFVAEIERALTSDDPGQRAARSERANGHSWDERIRMIRDELARPPANRATSADGDDRVRTARLICAPELASGALSDGRVRAAATRGDVGPWRVPSVPGRILQAQRRRSGRFDAVGAALGPAERLRRDLLGEAAAGPPRLLVRMDEYPHWMAAREPDRFGDGPFDRWHSAMTKAGCAHLIAVVPRIADDPYRRRGPSRDLTDVEVDRLRRLADDGVTFGLHGLDHRTRHPHPRLQTELGGRGARELAGMLDLGRDIMRDRLGVDPRVLVPPFNTFGAGQWRVLAERFDVVTGGPESIVWSGFQPSPVWREGAVYLPSYPPLYGTAADVAPEIERRIAQGTGALTPVVLHWGWEAERGWRDLERLADLMAPYAVPWNQFLDEVERSR